MAKQNDNTTSDRDLTLAVSDRDHSVGSTNPQVTLVEYGDYQCPYCRQAYYAVKSVQAKLGKELKFVFRNFPLTNSHPLAQFAAEAAEAAAAQGKFWEMHDFLYENQDRLGEELIFEAIQKFGMDETQFLSDLKTHKNKDRIREDFMSGVKSGVNGTPGFFVNGYLYNESWEEDDLLESLRALLHENRWQTP